MSTPEDDNKKPEYSEEINRAITNMIHALTDFANSNKEIMEGGIGVFMTILNLLYKDLQEECQACALMFAHEITTKMGKLLNDYMQISLMESHENGSENSDCAIVKMSCSTHSVH